MPLAGRKFTWSNNQVKAVISRIDWFLPSKEWEKHFAGAIQLALRQIVSDHCPIKLFSIAVDWGPKSFRFENYWFGGSSTRTSLLRPRMVESDGSEQLFWF